MLANERDETYTLILPISARENKISAVLLNGFLTDSKKMQTSVSTNTLVILLRVFSQYVFFVSGFIVKVLWQIYNTR
jgi:hypothetical protein